MKAIKMTLKMKILRNQSERGKKTWQPTILSLFNDNLCIEIRFFCGQWKVLSQTVNNDDASDDVCGKNTHTERVSLKSQ